MRSERIARRRARARRAAVVIWGSAVLAILILLAVQMQGVSAVQGAALEHEIGPETDETLVSLGEFKITHYCCEGYPHICNNGDWTITATGTTPTPGRTIGVDPDIIPYGTEVVIEGQTYVAEDTGGGIGGRHIDILVGSHSEALELGIRHAKVYVKKRQGG